MVVSQQKGQSLLEFLFALPVMFGITLILIRVNTAIQSSIVQQKYARGTATFLTWNSPYYPEVNNAKRMGYGGQNEGPTGTNEFILGVMANASNPDGSTTPMALDVPVTKKGPKHPPQGIPDQAKSIFLRNTVSLCTKTHMLANGALIHYGNVGINEQATFDFCRGRYD